MHSSQIRRQLEFSLLDHLVCLFTAALYSSTDVANLYLAKESPKSLHDMIIYHSQTIYPLWNNMVDAVRSVVQVPIGICWVFLH